MATIKLNKVVMATKVAAVEVQFLPCTVEADVPITEVQARFTRLVARGAGGRLEGVLRGRPLEGVVAALPKGYTGVVVAGQGKGLVEGQGRLARATMAFQELQYWNYDRKAGEGDAFQQAMQWTRVAEALHGE